MGRKGTIPVFFIRNDDSANNITTSAYLTLSASLPMRCVKLEIFHASANSIKLAVGPTGGEVDLFIVPPGGDSPAMVDVLLEKGARLSAKAVATNCTSGELIINGYY